MAIVNLSQIAAHLGFDIEELEDLEEDVAFIQGKVRAAQAHIEQMLGYKIEIRYANDEVPKPLREAVLQLTAWWFDNRDSVIERDRMMPFGVEDIINEYREWTF